MNIPINAVLPCRGCKADLQHKHTGGVVGTMRLKYACSGCSHVTEYDETSLRNALAAVVKDSDQTEPTPSPASTNGAAEVAEVYGYRLSRDDFWNAERFPSRQSALLQAVIAHSLPTGARVYVAVLAPDVLFSDEREHMIEQSEIAQANAIMRLSNVTGRRPIATAADVAKREQPPAEAPTAQGSATAQETAALRAPVSGDDQQMRDEISRLRAELEQEKALHHEDRISLADLEKAMVAGGFGEELDIYDADWLRAELRELGALRDQVELIRLERDEARDERDRARQQRDDQSTKLLALIDERRSERVARWWKTYDTVLPGLRVRGDIQEAHRQAKDHAELAHGPLPRSGHSVSFEVREREMSVPGNDANGSVESGDEVFPKGWARGKTGLGEPSIFIDHVSGACVWASDGAWAWSPNGTTGCVHGDRKAARIEAMAAALGFQIVGNREPPYGNSVDGSTLWTWRRHNVTTDIVEVGDAWKYTRENAALAALAFDVEQRKGSTKSEQLWNGAP